MPRPRKHRTTVRLTGITLRQQGTHDSLCAYYSAAMLLGALRPELEELFEAAHVAHDPLYAHLPRRRGSTVERAVADWLASGVRLEKLCRALNGACAQNGIRTRFRHRTAAGSDASLRFLHEQIDRGLPTILAWDSREMGNHTVLVVGYERYAGSESRWLRLLDPIRMQEVLEWGQLARLAGKDLEMIWCSEHAGVRPDKLTLERDPEGALLAGRTRVERWDPRARKFVTLVSDAAG